MNDANKSEAIQGISSLSPYHFAELKAQAATTVLRATEGIAHSAVSQLLYAELYISLLNARQKEISEWSESVTVAYCETYFELWPFAAIGD